MGGDICCNFILIKYKDLQSIIAMLAEDKVTELFCMADDLASLISNSASFFDKMAAKYTLKSEKQAHLPSCFHHVIGMKLCSSWYCFMVTLGDVNGQNPLGYESFLKFT